MHNLEKFRLAWDFDQLEVVFEHAYQADSKILGSYIRYLADIGKLASVKSILKSLHFSTVESGIREKIPDHNVLLPLWRFVHRDFQTVDNPHDELVALLWSGNTLAAKVFFEENIDALLARDGTPENAMVISFFMNEMMQERVLTAAIAMKMIHFIFENSKVNDTRRKYILRVITDYFATPNLGPMFWLGHNWYNHTHKMMSMAHWYSQSPAEIGAFDCAIRLQRLINARSGSAKKQTNLKPRVALLLSGLIRPGEDVFSKIDENITSAVDADVFLHTWDTFQIWKGNEGGNVHLYAERLFGDVDRPAIPDAVASTEGLQNLFPKTSEILLKAQYASVKEDTVVDAFKPTSYLIENAEEVLKRYNPSEGLQSRGNFNQFKMFYGIHKCFEMMRRNEKKGDFEYDYVIRCRVDLLLKDKFSFDVLKAVDTNLVASVFGFYGPNDQLLYGKRREMISILDLLPSMLEAENLSPFVDRPEIDSHNLLLSQSLHDGINFIPPKIRSSLSRIGGSAGTLPNLKKAIEADFKELPSHLQSSSEMIGYCNFLKTYSA